MLLGAPIHQWLTIAGLLLCSGMFSGSETALFSLTRADQRRMRGRGGAARRAAALLDSPRRVLLALLFGNMIINVLYFSTCTVVGLGLVREFGKGAGAAMAVASVLGVIVLGEVIPKIIAITRPGLWSRTVAWPLSMLVVTVTPVTLVLDAIVRETTRRMLGRTPPPHLTGEELERLVEVGERSGVLDAVERDMLQAVLRFGDLQTREVMVPRVDMVAVEADEPRDRIVRVLRETKVSRVMVYDDSVDHVLGAARGLDLILRPEHPVRELVSELPHVPETMPVDDLLQHLRRNHAAMALVVDEYGGTAGLVTLEDLLEAVVGDLRDEYDPADQAVETLDDGRMRLAGDLALHEWRAHFPVDLTDAHYETLAGAVLHRLGRPAREGDTVRVGDMILTVERVVGRRILSILAEPDPDAAEEDDR